MVKSSALALPVEALVLAVVLLGFQHRQMMTVEAGCARLRTRIAAGKAMSIPTADDDRHDPLAKRRKAAEWQKIAGYFPREPSMSSSIVIGDVLPDPRVETRFRQRMEAMSASEIGTTLDEIATLGLPPESLVSLQWTLLDSLARKNPGLALQEIADRDLIDNFAFGYLLSDTLQTWTAQNPAAAGAWFDLQIAAGKFDSKRLDGVSDSRQKLEAAIIGALLLRSPEAAAGRLAALPAERRADAMRMYSLTTVPEEIQAAHARLIRELVPVAKRAETIAAQVINLVGAGNFSSVDAYLERIDALPAERFACVETAAKNMRPTDPNSNRFTRGDFDALREWTARQAPDAVAAITGQALAEAAAGGRGMDFATAAGLAVEYGAADGGDATLASFLTGMEARRHKPEARALAERISDESRREEILNLLK